MPHVWKCFGTKIRDLASRDLQILSDLSRNIRTIKCKKKIIFHCISELGVMKRGAIDMKENFFDYGTDCHTEILF